MLQQMQEEQEEVQEDAMLDQMEDQEAWREAYGAPEPEEQVNSHVFLNKAAFESPNTTRTTFLSESELGRPLFSARFMMDMEDIAKFYIDPVCKKLGYDPKKENKIAKYFWEKLQNVTDSGMSNKGFSMNLNVTKKTDMSRTRFKPVDPPVKGGTAR